MRRRNEKEAQRKRKGKTNIQQQRDSITDSQNKLFLSFFQNGGGEFVKIIINIICVIYRVLFVLENGLYIIRVKK